MVEDLEDQEPLSSGGVPGEMASVAISESDEEAEESDEVVESVNERVWVECDVVKDLSGFKLGRPVYKEWWTGGNLQSLFMT